MLFNFTSEYAIRMITANREGSELNGAHWLLVRAEDATLLGQEEHNVRKDRHFG